MAKPKEPVNTYDIDFLDEYFDLILQKEAAETRLKELRAQIDQFLEDNGETKILAKSAKGLHFSVNKIEVHRKEIDLEKVKIIVGEEVFKTLWNVKIFPQLRVQQKL